MSETRKSQLRLAQKKSRSKKNNENQKQVSFYLPEGDLIKLQEICSKNNLSYAEFLTHAVHNEQSKAPIQLWLNEKHIQSPSKNIPIIRKLFRVFKLHSSADIETLEKELFQNLLNKADWEWIDSHIFRDEEQVEVPITISSMIKSIRDDELIFEPKQTLKASI
jgi:hypothetical protein